MSVAIRISDLFPFSVGESFDNEKCWDCPVQSKCEGGKFVVQLEVVSDDVPAIMDSYKETAGEAVIGTGTERIVAVALEMVDVLKAAKLRQDEAIAAGNVFLREIIDAQNMQPGRMIDQEEIYKPAVEKFVEAPVDTYVIDLSPNALGRISESIIHYAEIGVCGAIEVERNS